MNAVLIIAFGIGVFLPPGTLSAEMRTLLVTFFGLLSAGLLPALTLLVSAPPPTSFTVARLNKLDLETQGLIRGLISTLAYILAGGVMVLVAATPLLAVKMPATGHAVFDKLLSTVPERLLQAAVFSCFCVALDRLRVFVMTFKSIQSARSESAIEEAKRRIDAKVPTRENLRSSFKTSPLHGTIRPVVGQDTASSAGADQAG